MKTISVLTVNGQYVGVFCSIEQATKRAEQIVDFACLDEEAKVESQKVSAMEWHTFVHEIDPLFKKPYKVLYAKIKIFEEEVNEDPSLN